MAASNEDYQALGKAVEKVLASDYLNVIETKRRFLLMNFFKGIVTGFGGVIGATLVVALVLWLLNALDSIPFIDNIARNISDTIKQ